MTAPAAKLDVLIATGRVTVEHDNQFRSFQQLIGRALGALAQPL